MTEDTQPGHRDPAPGDLALVQAFVNSVDLEDGPDAFATVDGLRGWLVTHGLGEPDLELEAADRERAIVVREALRDLLAAHSNVPVAAGAGDRLAAAIAGVTGGFRLRHDTSLRFEPHGVGLAVVLGQLMSIIYEAQIVGTWGRLKTCRNDLCRWVFYDGSRNHSGTWCTMATCGNRTKARNYRRRH